MRIVICDDEPLAREKLVRIVERLGHEVVASSESATQAIDAICQYQPDTVLSDIRMPKVNGIDFAVKVGEMENPPAIIFVTNSNEYAIDAFQTNAIGYLLKPVKQADVAQALAKATQLNAAQFNQVKQLDLTQVKDVREHITARTHRGVEVIPLMDVYYLMADSKYVKARHKNGEVLLEKTLKELEQEFEHIMFRIHRNALINVEYLDCIETVASGQYQVRVKDIEECLAVSRRHVPELRQKIKDL